METPTLPKFLFVCGMFAAGLAAFVLFTFGLSDTQPLDGVRDAVRYLLLGGVLTMITTYKFAFKD